jgi:hypothetical protein
VEVAGGLVSLRNFPASDDSDFVDRVSGAFLRVSKDSSLSAGGSVLEMENARLTLGDELAFVDRGTITTTTAAPFARLTDSSLTAGDSLLAVTGGSVELHGPFLSAVRSDITATNAVGVFDGASVTGHSSLPFLSLDASTLTIIRNALEGYGGDLVIIGAGDVSTPPATLTLVGGLLSLSNASEVDVAGSLVNITNNGRLTVTATSSSAPLLQMSGATVHSTSGDVVRVENGGVLSLLSAGPLLIDAGSTLTLDEGDVLRLNNFATLTSASTQPLLEFTGSTVQARAGVESTGVGDLVRIRESSSMELHGSLLRASDTIFELAGMLLRVVHDSSLTVTGEGSDPLIQLSGGSVSTGNDLVRIGSPEFSDDGSRVTVPGAFVSLRNFPAGSLDIGSGTLLRIHGGSSLSAGGSIFDLENVNLTLNRALALLERGSTITTTAGPFAKISGGSLTADVLIGTDGVDNTIDLIGGFLDLSNTTVTLGRVAGPGSCDCTPTDTFTQTLGLNEPSIRMSNSNLSLTEFGAPLVEFAGPDAASTSQGGVALIATNTSGTVKTLSLLGPLLRLSGVTLTDPNAQIQLSGMTVTQNGSESELIEAFNLPITVRGPLLAATNSTLHIDFDVIGANDLTSTGAGALIALQNAPLTSTDGGVLSAFSAQLAGPILTAANSPIVLGSDVIFVGTLTSTGTAPLVSLSSSPLTATGRLLGVFFFGSGDAELAGSLLHAVNSGVTLDDHVIAVVGLTSTGAGPLISLQNSPLISPESLLSGSGSIGIVLENGVGRSVLPGSASLHGSLLAATTSPITLDGAVAFLGSLASTGTDALVSLQGSPLTATGAMVVANSVTLAGSALAATDSPVTLGGPVLSIANLTSTGSAPLISLQNSPLAATGLLVINSGLAGFGNVFNAPQVRHTALAGPLLAATDSAVTLTGDAIAVAAGASASLTSTTTQALVSLVKTPNSSSDSSLTAGGSLLAVRFGSRADLDGPLLSAVRSDVTATNAVGVFDGGIVTSSSSSPFLSLDASTLTIHDLLSEGYGGDLVIVGAGGVPGGTLSLNGRLLDLSNASVVTVAGSLLEVTNGGQFTVPAGTTLVSVGGGSSLTVGSGLNLTGASLDLGQTGTVLSVSGGSHFTVTVGPVVKITSGSLTADLLASSDGLGNQFNITGTLFDLTNANVALRQIAEEPDDSTDIVRLNLALNQPFIRMSGSSTLTTTGLNADLIEFGNNLPLATDGERRTTPGIALSATGGVLNLKGSLLRLRDIDSMADAAFIQLASTTINQTGTLRALVVVDPGGGTTTMTAPLLTASNSTIGTSGAFALFRNGQLTSNTTSPFISFNPSTLTSARHILLFDDGISVNLSGFLLSAQDTVFNATSPDFSAFTVLNGASVTTTGTSAPLLEFLGTAQGLSKVTAARVFLPLAVNPPGGLPPSMTLSASLLRAIQTDFKTGDSAANTFPLLFVGDNATLTGPSVRGSEPAAVPLVTFSFSSLDSAGGFLTLRRSNGAEASRVILQGPLLDAEFSTFTTFSSSRPGVACCSFVFVGEGAQLTDTGTTPLLRFTSSVFPKIGGSLVNVDDFAGQLNSAGQPDSVSSPGFVSLAGRLVEDVGGRYTLNGSVLRIRNGSQVHGSGAGAFLSFTNSTVGAPPNGNMSLLNQGSINDTSSGGFPSGDPRNTSLLSLVAPLLVAINSNFNTGTFSTFVGIRDGAHVVGGGSGTGAFIQLDNSPVTASANFFAVTRFLDSNNQPIGSQEPISITLARPLLSAVVSDVTAITGFVSIGDNTTFTSTTPNALIDIVESHITVGGVHPLTQAPVAARLFTLFERGGFTPSMTINGSLFSGDDSTISTTSDVFGVFRAPLQSSTTQPFINLFLSSVQAGGTFFNANGFPGGTNVPADAPSTLTPVTFGGSLLVTSFTDISTAGNFLNFTFGADVGGGAGTAFVDLRQSSIVTTAGAGPGDFLLLCCGTPAAKLTFRGSLLASVDSNLNLDGSLVDISNGATLVTLPNPSGVPYPLVSLDLGQLLAGGHIFNLVGRLLVGGVANTVPDPDPDPVLLDVGTGLIFGKDQPLQHGGGRALFEASTEAIAEVGGSAVRVVDAQLLAATLPALVNLMGGADLTTGSHAVDLVQNAKLDVGLGDVVRLTNSTLNVGRPGSNVVAHLLNVNASRVNAGTLAALAGGSTINVLNGALLNLMNGGIANFVTSLVSFTGTGSLNVINVTNTFAPTTFIGGIPIFVAPGATFNFSINGTPLAGLGTNGAININGASLQPNATSGVTGSLVAVQGTGGTLKIGTVIAAPLPGSTPIGPPTTGTLKP